MQKFNLYLFDFDGTLFDTLASSKYVFKKSYAAMGIDIEEEEVVAFTRIPIPEGYAKVGAPPEQFILFLNNLLKYVSTTESVNLTKIFPDTYEALIDLRSAEAELGIVTSNNAKHVKRILKKFHMQDYFFSVIVGYEEAPISKPDPSPILKALEMLKYQGDKSDVCYVGDSLNDCKAATNAGVTPILLDRENEYPDIPYLKIVSLNDLLK